jgi:4-amino-4-deoxy-L-arabinose transferase-like glycosyltransferase
MALPKYKHRWWAGTLCTLIFFLLGCAVLPYPGLQNDEVLFAPADFQVPGSSIFQLEILHRQIPVMLMTYLGALKSWLYAGLLAVLPPSYWTVRLPVLFLGAATVWLFVVLLDAVHGRRAAWAGGILLTTDTMFLLTTCFDWGPVALQHFLLVAGLLLVVQFAARPTRASLFWGFFCVGLALWDKALFIWNLGGLALGTLVIFPRQLRSYFTLRNAGLATAGFCIGALPLIIYNCESGLSTFRSNSSFRFDEFQKKFNALRGTWKGSLLLGFLASEPGEPGQPREAQNELERVSFALHSAGGEHRSNRLEWAFVVGLLLIPLLWRTPARKTMLFCLLALAGAWLLNAITKDAGGSAHHSVLLWPIPHLFLAVAFAEVSLRGRRFGAGVLAVAIFYLAAQNLLLTNQYLYQLARYGSPRNWTDAIYPLSDELGKMRPAQIVLADWGIHAPLVLLQRGTLPMTIVDAGFLSPQQGEAARNWDLGRLEQGLWVGHTPAYREFVQLHDDVLKVAAAAGFQKEMIKVVSDSHGRPAFEIFRFAPDSHSGKGH